MSQVYKDIIRLTIDLKTGVEETILPIKQSDNLSRVLRCQLKNNNKPINLKGSQLILYVVKADKTLSMINGVINQAKVGLVDFELTEQSLALVDEIQCEIVKIDGNNVKLSFPIFKVNIEDSIYDEGLIESQHEFSALTALISNVAGWDNKFTTMYEDLETKLDSEIAKTNAQLSEVANKGTTVEVIERVTKEEIDRQIADGTIANLTIEDDSISGEKIKFSSIRPEHISGVDTKGFNLFNHQSYGITNGKFLMVDTGQEIANGTNYNYSISHYVDVIEGEEYTISSSGQEALCFYDSSKKYVEGIKNLNAGNKSFTFTVPVRSKIKYMRVNINKDFQPLNEFFILRGTELKDKLIIPWLGIANENLLQDCVEPHNILGTEKLPQNIFDNTSEDIVEGKFLMANSGATRDDIDYSISHVIPVKSGDKFTGQFAQQVCCFYNKNMVFVSGIEDTTINSNDLIRTITVPDNPNIKYMKVNIQNKLNTNGEYMILTGDKYSDIYIPFGDAKYTISWLNIPGTQQVRDFKGKRWLTIGDSITEKNFRATKNYHDYIKEWLGCEVKNVASSGTGYINEFNGVKGWLDRLPTFPEESEVDFITVMGGLNDKDHPVGSFGSSDKTELYGALKLFYEGLIQKYPNTPIGIITSTPRDYCWGETGQYVSHINAIIEMAQNYSFPVLDLYRYSGLRPWNDINNKEYFSTQGSTSGDGTHPNEKGQLVMAYKIYGFIQQYL